MVMNMMLDGLGSGKNGKSGGGEREIGNPPRGRMKIGVEMEFSETLILMDGFIDVMRLKKW